MEIGHKIIHLTDVDSTNNYAANLLKQGIIESGTVILADEQHAGRGQRGTEWSVNPGENLTFSIFLDNVNLSVDRQFVLTQFISCCLTRLLEKNGLTCKIKWPNDIYFNDKKIAGVLIENQLSGKRVKSSIIGIGLNLNQVGFDGFVATSTLLETGVRRIPKDVLLSFCNVFNENWNDWMKVSNASDNEIYLKQLYQLNEPRVYKDTSGQFDGVIRGVTDSGRLVLQKENREVSYDLKEIAFMR